MSKKHFEALAKALLAVRPSGPTTKEFGIIDPMLGLMSQWNTDVRAVSRVCQQMNPRFDAERFLTACGGYQYHQGE